MASDYAAWARTDQGIDKRNRWSEALAECLPSETSILDLGCGPGHEVECWVHRGMFVTGVDLSEANITLARQRTPRAIFVCADMAGVRFSSGSFDIAAAFYSLIHVPAREQAHILARIYAWLKPGGCLLANIASRPFDAMYENNWLGAQMFWSSLGMEKVNRILVDTGFRLLRTELCPETNFGRKNTFFWFVAQKPRVEAENNPDLGSKILGALDRCDPPAVNPSGNGGERA
jgi:SAM-dependent methyltransferase